MQWAHNYVWGHLSKFSKPKLAKTALDNKAKYVREPWLPNNSIDLAVFKEHTTHVNYTVRLTVLKMVPFYIQYSSSYTVTLLPV